MRIRQGSGKPICRMSAKTIKQLLVQTALFEKVSNGNVWNGYCDRVSDVQMFKVWTSNWSLNPALKFCLKDFQEDSYLLLSWSFRWFLKTFKSLTLSILFNRKWRLMDFTPNRFRTDFVFRSKMFQARTGCGQLAVNQEIGKEICSINFEELSVFICEWTGICTDWWPMSGEIKIHQILPFERSKSVSSQWELPN